MPVLSPKPAVHDPLIAADPSKKREISVVGAPQEESITNVKPEKLANMKMMMKTYVFSALKEKEVGNDERYNQLVSLLTTDPTQPDAPSPLKVYVWMMVLSQSVSQLDKSCATLVEAVLRIDWSVQEEPFASAYIEFLENLVSAHAFYVTPIMRCIARNFQFRQRLPPYAKVKRTVAYRRNHEALRSILRLIPTSTNTLFQSLNRVLPHHTLNTAAQATYIKNILEILDYVPFLRRQILQLVITHMVTIDAHIQIELDELDDEVDFDTYNMDFDKDYESGDESEENDDDDGSSVGTDIEEDYDEKEFAKKMASGREKQVRYIQSMVRKLDSMMCLALGYLARFAVKSSAEDRIDVFHILISAFDHSIVKTLKSRYTQFLLFYFCSLDPELFPEHFINHLMEHIADTSRPGITRVACAAYMSSYVARAKSLDPAAIQRAVGLLSSWCMDYVEQYETSTVQPDAGKYDIFYAAMQAIMYIFCFRWRELVVNDDLEAAVSEDTPRPTGQPDADGMPIIAFDGSSISRNWCSGLRNIPRLVTSRFNPLKVCAPMVVKQFARISHDSNFMYVYPILERNKHVFVPGISDGPLSKEQSILLTVQTFFPFDPYKLNSSKSFIDNIYFEWQADDDEESDEESDEEDEDDEEGDEDVTTGITAMSISPSPNHFMPVP